MQKLSMKVELNSKSREGSLKEKISKLKRELTPVNHKKRPNPKYFTRVLKNTIRLIRINKETLTNNY